MRQRMASFLAEMRDIDQGDRIVGVNLQNLTRLERLQALAKFQDGQGTYQAAGIEEGIVIHDCDA